MAEVLTQSNLDREASAGPKGRKAQKDSAIRIQFETTQGMVDLLDDLADETGMRTRAEVLRRAISVYGLLVRRHRAGSEVHLYDPQTKETVALAVY